MNLGERLLNLRKSKNLSQEEAADKLNVSRQTISKWETNQSTPDFDKIIPICTLYEITTEELLTGNKEEKIESTESNSEKKIKRAKGISLSILLYFIAVISIIVTIPYLRLDPILATSIFLAIAAVATFILVYTCLMYKEDKKKKENKLKKQIKNILALITTIIYLLISFITNAWHITWIIWIIFGLISEIINLLFIMRSNDNE